MGHGIASMLLVALGGALGGMGRYAVSNLMAHLLGKAFPWGTLLVNASGAFIAGGLLGYYGVPTTQPLWLFSVAGLLGGYTTVSSFSLQTIELWQSGQALRAALNIAATLVLGMVMAMLGWLLAKGLLL
ncbi:fluoride efflux transporter CrcB [Vreelandella alkaliphila]|uniref:Fluoride-specific ion channel FluC n=1 Tax=Halomonas campaniensis TaxID=213554 RepID=A0A3D0KCY5_9GAMM|nr:fluoride efflux transporter CrcB [Halomonas sp. 3F2F]HCA01041.1 fluoride efflux transporter CrcB [Halomonas campaniensis]